MNENYKEMKFTEYVKHKGEPDWEIRWNKRMLELIDTDPTGGAREKRLILRKKVLNDLRRS